MQLWKILLPLMGNMVFAGATSYAEKIYVFNQARQKADELNKKLLNYGCGSLFCYALENSDVNMDLVPRNVPNFMLSVPDSGRLPFPDKHFGTVFLSHVLEHTDNPQFLLTELNRVSDYVYVIVPKWWSIGAWLNPSHKRMYLGKYTVEAPQTFMGPLVTGLTLLLTSL